MRGGRPIGLIAITLVGAGLLEPTWQWFVSRVLDSAASKPGGIESVIERGVSIMHPAQQLLFGIAAGMFAALAIGYWKSIGEIIKAVPGRIADFLFMLLPEEKEKSIYRGTVTFRENETVHVFKVDPYHLVGAKVVRIPLHSDVKSEILPHGEIIFRRTDKCPQTLRFEVL